VPFFFQGTIKFAPWRKVWNYWAPLKCKYFVWFALNNTGLRIASPKEASLTFGLLSTTDAGLEITSPKEASLTRQLAPSVTRPKKIFNTASLMCVRQVWTLIFQKLKLYAVRPPESTSRFYGWWCRTLRSVPKEMHKGVNSLVILVAWELWKQ